MDCLYTDRQGCIQSRGFNFIQDLTTFFVLLLALQRLDLRGWDLNPTLDARVSRAHQGMLKSNEEGRTYEPAEWEVKINAKPITLERNELPSDLTMTGRGTVTVEGFSSDPARQRQQLAVKMYWPEAHLTEENVFINNLPEGTPTSQTISLPSSPRKISITHLLSDTRLVWRQENAECCVSLPLPTLNLSPSSPNMSLFVLGLIVSVMGVTKPHSSLNISRSCLGHFKLWQLGFQHGNLSLSNIMINPSTKRGVLNGWDLSYDSSDSSNGDAGHVAGGERTGTLAFMTLELLTDQAWNGNVRRLYRHDLEGFIWMLPWVFLQYEDSVLTIPVLEKWQSGDYTECARAKRDLLSEFESEDIATESWKAEWELAYPLLYWLMMEESTRKQHRKAPLSLSPKDVFNSFHIALCITLQCYAPWKNSCMNSS